MQRIAFFLSVALGAQLLSFVSPLAIERADAADKPAPAPHVSPKLVKPLKAAQEAMQKQDWDTALAQTLEANAIPEQTPYDHYQINEFLSFIYLKKADYTNAAVAYDEVLSSEFVPPEQLVDRLKVATQLNFQIKNYPKSVEYAKRWVEATGGKKSEPIVMLAQAYYVQDDYKNAGVEIQKAIDVARQAGEPVKEQYLQIALSCAVELDDQAGIRKVLEQLLREYPTPKYWEQMFSLIQGRTESDDRTSLNVLRLMFEVGVMKRPDDYVELAQLAFDAGVPGETVTVLQDGFAKKLLDGKDVERRRQFLQDAEKQAQSDQKALPGLDKEARASKTGEADVGLGIAYLSYGQYDKAVEALERGLQKGGVKRLDDAQITLGRALLKLNRNADAVKAFDAVPKDSKLAQVAALWAIYAQKGAGTGAA